MIDLIPLYLFKSLIITLIIELFVALLLNVRGKKNILNIALVNIFTNILLNAFLIPIGIFGGLKIWLVCLIVFEILIVFAEGLMYKAILTNIKINCLFLSLILNACSLFIGYFLN